jgi:hypothetical protein
MGRPRPAWLCAWPGWPLRPEAGPFMAGSSLASSRRSCCLRFANSSSTRASDPPADGSPCQRVCIVGVRASHDRLVGACAWRGAWSGRMSRLFASPPPSPTTHPKDGPGSPPRAAGPSRAESPPRHTAPAANRASVPTPRRGACRRRWWSRRRHRASSSRTAGVCADQAVRLPLLSSCRLHKTCTEHPKPATAYPLFPPITKIRRGPLPVPPDPQPASSHSPHAHAPQPPPALPALPGPKIVPLIRIKRSLLQLLRPSPLCPLAPLPPSPLPPI